jgi:hypothetical protein
MPQIIAKAKDEIYIKEKNEDFINLYSGIVGQKKGIHIHIGNILDSELDEIKNSTDKVNKQIQAVANAIDQSIIKDYYLWPTNYVAYDILHNSNRFVNKYTEKEKLLFERRLELRVNKQDKTVVDSFLAMYANPVINKLKLTNEQ